MIVSSMMFMTKFITFMTNMTYLLFTSRVEPLLKAKDIIPRGEYAHGLWAIKQMVIIPLNLPPPVQWESTNASTIMTTITTATVQDTSQLSQVSQLPSQIMSKSMLEELVETLTHEGGVLQTISPAPKVTIPTVTMADVPQPSSPCTAGQGKPPELLQINNQWFVKDAQGFFSPVRAVIEDEMGNVNQLTPSYFLHTPSLKGTDLGMDSPGTFKLLNLLRSPTVKEPEPEPEPQGQPQLSSTQLDTSTTAASAPPSSPLLFTQRLSPIK